MLSPTHLCRHFLLMRVNPQNGSRRAVWAHLLDGREEPGERLFARAMRYVALFSHSAPAPTGAQPGQVAIAPLLTPCVPARVGRKRRKVSGSCCLRKGPVKQAQSRHQITDIFIGAKR